MRNINYVQLLGNVVEKPEIKAYQGDQKLATFTVATNVNYKDKNDNWQSIATYHKCVCYITKLAELIEKQVSKWDAVIIEGSLNNRSYEDKNGVTKYVTEIKVDDFNYIGRLQKKDDNWSADYQASDSSKTSKTPPKVNSYHDTDEIAIEDIEF